MGEMLFCPKCKKTMQDIKFYQYRDGTKCELCKECLTMHIDNFDPETFKWALEKFDVPYLYWEWNIIRDRAYAKDPYKMNGLSVFGKYLSRMKLKQHMNDRWADTERLTYEHDEEAKLHGNVNQVTEEKMAEMKEAYENGEISSAQWMTYQQTEGRAPDFEVQDGAVTTSKKSGYDGGKSVYPVNDSPYIQVELPDIAADLTEEDKIYLATRWGQLYTPQEWVTLEKLYNDYEKSFDLHNADLTSGTIQLCKLDLKGNQALDSGDYDGYSKIARASDSLRKSLKFTEAQRKEIKGAEFSSYGQIVAFAERMNDEDYISSIDLKVDRDMVDRDIRDIKNYTRDLIAEDPAVFKMIEQYIKKREALRAQEEDEARFSNGGEYTDAEMQEFSHNIEEQREIDNQSLQQEEDDE